MNTSPAIAIIGAGRIGKAIARLLRRHSIRLWDRDEEKMNPPMPLSEALRASSIIFICVPTSAVEELLSLIKKSASADSAIVSLSKGLRSNGQTLPSLYQREFGDHFALLSGAMIAEDIEKDLPSFATIATVSPSLTQQLRSLFANTQLRLNYSTDVEGIAWTSVLKNVYALWFGIVDGLALGDNCRGWLAVEALREMQAILALEGGNPATAFSNAGLGDLIATGTSQHSNNYKTGVSIAMGHVDVWEGSEGVRSVHILSQRHREQLNDLLLVDGLRCIILKHASPKEVLQRLWA